MQEGVAVARGAVAEAVPLPQETPAPHQGTRSQGATKVLLTAPYLDVLFVLIVPFELFGPIGLIGPFVLFVTIFFLCL